ncbi:MAG: cytochrome c, partial [Gemmatimonadota bacterium]
MKRAVVGLLVLLASACSPSGEPPAADLGAGTPEGLPSWAPDRFGFGSPASAERVAMWDIDVRPDGTGLPAGSGTVEEGRRVYETYCVECHGATG